MKHKHFFHPFFLTFLGTLFCFFSVFFQAHATEPLDVNYLTDLTIQYRLSGVNVSGANFRLYHVADVSDKVYFTPTGQFASYSGNLNGLTPDEWKDLANTLKRYILDNGLKPDYPMNLVSAPQTVSATTDSNGEAITTSLKAGIWLIIGEKTVLGDYTYTSDPFLVSLPQIDETDESWIYGPATVLPKVQRVKNPNGGNTSRTAIKVWQANGDTKRPDTITLNLYADGVLKDSQVIGAAENWRYTWKNLPKQDKSGGKIEYTISEVPVAGFGTTYRINGTTTTITNGPPGGGPSGDPKGGPLPQTGQLWWPVPIFLFAGVLFAGLGCVELWRKKQ